MIWLALCVASASQAADFDVTTPGGQFAFRINGMDNPDLTLERGRTYTFAINTDSIHPFALGALDGGFPFGPTPSGVSNNNINSGTITYAVPMDATDCGYYCSFHFFYGFIHFVDAAPPPTIQIVSLNVNTNLVLTSTGTNNWSLIPEYSTNLMSTNWYALSVSTNNFTAGTNETICGLPPGEAVFIRIRAQKN